MAYDNPFWTCSIEILPDVKSVGVEIEACRDIYWQVALKFARGSFREGWKTEKHDEEAEVTAFDS